MGHLLFDFVAIQPNGITMEHGGKKYGEAVLNELISRNIPLSGIIDSSLQIEEKYISYIQNYGTLIDKRKTSLQEVIDSGKYSVFYSAIPYSIHNIRWGNTVFIGNIHGLRPIEAFTDRFEYKYSWDTRTYVKALIKSIPFIQHKFKSAWLKKIENLLENPSFICISGSNHTKYALLKYFPNVSSDRIHVFYDPLDMENSQAHVSENEKYYMLVSGNRWLKNTYRGIIALDQLISSRQIQAKVIVTGTVNNMRYMKEIKNKDSFIFKGYVSSSELASLYQGAYCLVFLSLSEGFGYPPLEAISRGTPVICSPLTSLYEVYQNSVLYCDPFSIEDIKVKVLQMEDNNIHSQYKYQGLSHAKKMIERQKLELPKIVDYILSFCK